MLEGSMRSLQWVAFCNWTSISKEKFQDLLLENDEGEIAKLESGDEGDRGKDALCQWMDFSMSFLGYLTQTMKVEGIIQGRKC